MDYKTYQKENDTSYVFGAFPTVELLKHRPNDVKEILLHEKTEQTAELQTLMKLAKECDVKVTTHSKLVEKLSKKGNVYAVGVFQKYNQTLNPKQNQIVLVHPSDAGNLGTIMREMFGFGYQNLAIITPAVDMFDPKVIRASMGAIFGLNIQLFDSFAAYQKQNPISCYPFMLNGTAHLQTIGKIDAPHALIFGNEATGLDSSFSNIGQSIVIDHSKQIDSLNLALSVGIAMYELSKK